MLLAVGAMFALYGIWAALAAVVCLLILLYLVPDILNGDWGHIVYSAVMEHR